MLNVRFPLSLHLLDCFPHAVPWSRRSLRTSCVKRFPCLHPAGSDLLTCRLLQLQCSCSSGGGSGSDGGVKPVNKTASMAAKHIYRQGFLLLLCNFICIAALERRFSDIKRCADEECSSKWLLLLWGDWGMRPPPFIPLLRLAIKRALSPTCCQSICATLVASSCCYDAG